MSDDTGHDTGHDDDATATDGWEASDAPTTGSTPRVREPVPHSRLVGFMAEPLARQVPFRRSTVLMLVAFLGFGTLCYLYPPTSTTTSTGTSTGSGGIPGVFVPSATTSTTAPPTTTSTRPVGPGTTTTTTTTATTRPTTTTTTTSRPVSSTTTSTTLSGQTTTTTLPAATTTTSGP